MRLARLLFCAVLLAAGVIACSSRTARQAVSSAPPSSLDFAAFRSTEDNADIEIKEATLIGTDGSRQRPNCSGGNTLTCYVRKGGAERTEQQVASLAYG